MSRMVCVASLIVISSWSAFAQEEVPAFLPHEVTLALGAAFPFENDPLNVPGEEKIPPSLCFDIGYRRFLTEQGAIGVRGFGYVRKLPDYLVASASNPIPSPEGFTLSVFNISLEGLWLFSRKPVRPFVYVMVTYATGAITNSQAGTLRYDGGAGGGGFGLRMDLSRTVALSLEGMGSWGSAVWRNKPFTNSNGNKFDPGLLDVLFSFSFRWP